MASDRIVWEFITTANMAGVEAAKGGLLGMSGALMGVTAGLTLLAAGTKSMIDLTEQHAQAEAALSNAITNRGGNMGVAQQQLDQFILTNRDFISSQADVITSYATLVREGVSQKDVIGLLNTAMNISAVENVNMTDAVNMLQSAEAGRVIGLKKLVGVTLEAIPAHDTLAQKQVIIAKNMDIVAAAYKNGTDALTPLTKETNALSMDWQDIANNNGPLLVGAIVDVEKHLDTLLLKMSDPKTTDAFFNSLDSGIIAFGTLLEESAAGLNDLAQQWTNFVHYVTGTTPESSGNRANNYASTRGGYSAANNAANMAGQGPAGSYASSPTNSGFNLIGGRLATVDPTTHELLRQLVDNTSGQRGGPQIDGLANQLAQRLGYTSGT